MDYFAVSCSNGHGSAEEGVSQEFMLKRWDAWAARITSILSSPIHPCPTCGRMPHVKANDLGLKLDCECRASSNPVSDPVAAIELWERNIEKRKRLKADVEFLNGIIARSSAVGCNGSGWLLDLVSADSEARTVPAGQSAAAKGESESPYTHWPATDSHRGHVPHDIGDASSTSGAKESRGNGHA